MKWLSDIPVRDDQELISFWKTKDKKNNTCRTGLPNWCGLFIIRHCWNESSSTFTAIPLWCVDLWVQQSESTSTVDDAGDDVAVAGCCWTSCSDSVPLATLVKSNGSDKNNNNNSCCTSLMVAARIIITRQEKRLDGTSNSQHSLLYPPDSERDYIVNVVVVVIFQIGKKNKPDRSEHIHKENRMYWNVIITRENKLVTSRVQAKDWSSCRSILLLLYALLTHTHTHNSFKSNKPQRNTRHTSGGERKKERSGRDLVYRRTGVSTSIRMLCVCVYALSV